MAMFRAAAMQKLRIFILERDVQRVTGALGRLGVVHLQNSVEESGGELQPEELDEETGRFRALVERLRRLTERLEVQEAEHGPSDALKGADVAQVEKVVNSLESGVSAQTDDLEKAEQALADTDEILRELAPYRDVRVPLRSLARSDLLAMKACSADPSQLESVRSAMPDGVLLTPLAGGEGQPVNLLVVSSRRRRFAMETVLQECGLEERQLPPYENDSLAAIYQQAAARGRSLQEKAAVLRAGLRAVGKENEAWLRQAHGTLSVQLKLYEAERNFGSTWATAVISGWIPAVKAEGLRTVVTQATHGECIIDIADPDREDIEKGRVPSCPVHNRLLAPFERLVRGYSVASYTEIEPTLLFAVSFLLMFGVIFGDLGHGLCLLAIGLLTRRAAKSPPVHDVGCVIAASGLASMLFGTFLQGSFFGAALRDMGFPLTLGFAPIRFEGGAGGNVVRYLILAVVFGIALISLGAILNIINRLRTGDYEEGLLGRFGLAGIIFYWGALALTVKLVVAGPGRMDAWLAVVMLGLPLTALALHEPLCALVSGRRPLWRDGPGIGLFQGLVEAVEAATVYAANTFSFLRVAAFALSHAALCFTILILQRLVNGLPGGPLWTAAVFALGTALIIGLEGLIVAVQILRLEYYEFFTKFFRGEGVPYKPFRLG